ncbi:DUF423 domain-containing protein [Aquimarina brevivitae]|uniref:Uncharacterized membrane protein YgdD (TMEM256/DUF423 family) n=1 Tax=Aquimarina brevivitae TaxID=323412 RepID=A0A4Q7PGK2_9FLAO|nr:DUF423 domain-containing protein [Aquimarina brevivitae]RZS99636.1 uncharacterized membrane protein YgdD (TMEM256/DUF423 family) [Aquimarina brevivitae]
MNQNKTILITGSVVALLSVLFGAFGAHGLKGLVDSDGIASFTTAVRYQMYHALFLLILGGLSFLSTQQKRIIYRLILAGILLFSGSIYILVLDEIVGVNLSSIGFITPIGGLLLITGWVFTTYYIAKIK